MMSDTETEIYIKKNADKIIKEWVKARVEVLDELSTNTLIEHELEFMNFAKALKDKHVRISIVYIDNEPPKIPTLEEIDKEMGLA